MRPTKKNRTRIPFSRKTGCQLVEPFLLQDEQYTCGAACRGIRAPVDLLRPADLRLAANNVQLGAQPTNGGPKSGHIPAEDGHIGQPSADHGADIHGRTHAVKQPSAAGQYTATPGIEYRYTERFWYIYFIKGWGANLWFMVLS